MAQRMWDVAREGHHVGRARGGTPTRSTPPFYELSGWVCGWHGSGGGEPAASRGGTEGVPSRPRDALEEILAELGEGWGVSGKEETCMSSMLLTFGYLLVSWGSPAPDRRIDQAGWGTLAPPAADRALAKWRETLGALITAIYPP